MEDIFKFGASAAVSRYKYQVEPRLLSWLSAACAAAVAHKNIFFVCVNRMNLLRLKRSPDR